MTGSKTYVAAQEPTYRHTCGKCGATRIDNQIGLEPTLAEYIDTMTAVFRDVRRVLRSDGVCWLNIGDSYAGSGPSGAGYQSETTKRREGMTQDGNFLLSKRIGGGDPGYANKKPHVIPSGLKPKDLMMVPARLALALQADGWWLRSDIIWHKPNPMPESVTDRPTNAHEHIFLLTKSARYWYDADAVREAMAPESASRYAYGFGGAKNEQLKATDNRTAVVGHRDATNGANLRNVWSISTVGYPGAHFATFPPEIPRRCIKAGTSEHGCCSACGGPWSRVVERTFKPMTDRSAAKLQKGSGEKGLDNSNGWSDTPRGTNEVVTLGWQPGCTCDADVIPCTVMDPFFGAGTTGLVADQLGRDCIGIELNPEYARMAEDRIRGAAPLLAEVVA